MVLMSHLKKIHKIRKSWPSVPSCGKIVALYLKVLGRWDNTDYEIRLCDVFQFHQDILFLIHFDFRSCFCIFKHTIRIS